MEIVMTPEHFQTQMAKLNKAQQKKVRALFSGRIPVEFSVDESISKITVEFSNKVTHFVILGPRGGIVYHETEIGYGDDD